jgi:hypothetical protein
LLFDDQIELQRGSTARVVVRRAAQPIPLSPARATRRGGLVVLSGRAAHETTLAGLEARPGARHLYGEVRCEAIERLQREALETPRPQVVVRVDRGGLNEAHPLVRQLHAKLERILRPIVDAEERRAGARLVRAGKETLPETQLGCARSTTRSAPPLTRPGEPASPAAADRPRSNHLSKSGRSARTSRRQPHPARPPSSTPPFASSSRRCDFTRASSERSRSSSTRHGSRLVRRSTSRPIPACRSRSGATRYRRRFRADGRA